MHTQHPTKKSKNIYDFQIHWILWLYLHKSFFYALLTLGLRRFFNEQILNYFPFIWVHLSTNLVCVRKLLKYVNIFLITEMKLSSEAIRCYNSTCDYIWTFDFSETKIVPLKSNWMTSRSAITIGGLVAVFS